MPQYTPNNGTPYLIDSDVPDIGMDGFNLAYSIEKKLVPNFASTGVRDTKIAGTSTGVNPPGPTVGQLITVGSGVGVQAQLWDTTAWQPVAMVLSARDASGGNSPTTAVATAAWTVLALSQTDYIIGTGITNPNTTQLQVTTAGRYQIIAMVAWPASGTGRRIIGYCLNGATDPGTGFAVKTNTPPSQAWNQEYVNEINLAANDSVALYAYQDSGGSLTVGQRRLMLRRVG